MNDNLNRYREFKKQFDLNSAKPQLKKCKGLDQKIGAIIQSSKHNSLTMVGILLEGEKSEINLFFEEKYKKAIQEMEVKTSEDSLYTEDMFRKSNLRTVAITEESENIFEKDIEGMPFDLVLFYEFCEMFGLATEASYSVGPSGGQEKVVISKNYISGRTR